MPGVDWNWSGFHPTPCASNNGTYHFIISDPMAPGAFQAAYASASGVPGVQLIPIGPNQYTAHLPAAAVPYVLRPASGLEAHSGQPYDFSSPWPDGSNGQPTPSMPGAQGGADGLSTPERNELNCRLDPVNWACPTRSADGSGWVTNGGPIMTNPDCYGLSVSECEDAISQAGGTVTFTTQVDTAVDPDVADGYVLHVVPVTRVIGNTTPITIYTNAQHNSTPACTTRTDYPHWSDAFPGVVAKGSVLCNTTTTVQLSMTMWSCDQQPQADLARLNAGDWDCQVAAVNPGESVPVRAGQWSDTIKCPPSGSVAANAWFVAQTVSPDATPSWSGIVYVNH